MLMLRCRFVGVSVRLVPLDALPPCLVVAVVDELALLVGEPLDSGRRDHSPMPSHIASGSLAETEMLVGPT
jgi:hypothetical protein